MVIAILFVIIAYIKIISNEEVYDSFHSCDVVYYGIR